MMVPSSRGLLALDITSTKGLRTTLKPEPAATCFERTERARFGRSKLVRDTTGETSLREAEMSVRTCRTAVPVRAQIGTERRAGVERMQCSLRKAGRKSWPHCETPEEGGGGGEGVRWLVRNEEVFVEEAASALLTVSLVDGDDAKAIVPRQLGDAVEK